MYLCIFNPATKEIKYAEEVTDPVLIPLRRESMFLQSRIDGPEWYPYCDETPFAFPIETPAP